MRCARHARGVGRRCSRLVCRGSFSGRIMFSCGGLCVCVNGLIIVTERAVRVGRAARGTAPVRDGVIVISIITIMD